MYLTRGSLRETKCYNRGKHTLIYNDTICILIGDPYSLENIYGKLDVTALVGHSNNIQW